jgi:hypothetical protein
MRARLDVGNMLLNLRGHDLLLQACKQRFALCSIVNPTVAGESSSARSIICLASTNLSGHRQS